MCEIQLSFLGDKLERMTLPTHNLSVYKHKATRANAEEAEGHPTDLIELLSRQIIDFD